MGSCIHTPMVPNHVIVLLWSRTRGKGHRAFPIFVQPWISFHLYTYIFVYCNEDFGFPFTFTYIYLFFVFVTKTDARLQPAYDAVRASPLPVVGLADTRSSLAANFAPPGLGSSGNSDLPQFLR